MFVVGQKVFSLCRMRWFDRITVLGVQCCSRCGSLSFLDFGLKTADVTLMDVIIAVSVSCSALLRICFISFLKSLPYIVGFLGKFPCLCAFLKI